MPKPSLADEAVRPTLHSSPPQAPPQLNNARSYSQITTPWKCVWNSSMWPQSTCHQFTSACLTSLKSRPHSGPGGSSHGLPPSPGPEAALTWHCPAGCAFPAPAAGPAAAPRPGPSPPPWRTLPLWPAGGSPRGGRGWGHWGPAVRRPGLYPPHAASQVRCILHQLPETGPHSTRAEACFSHGARTHLGGLRPNPSTPQPPFNLVSAYALLPSSQPCQDTRGIGKAQRLSGEDGHGKAKVHDLMQP